MSKLNNILKRIIPYAVAFFGGNIFAILMLMGRYTNPEMVRELIFYAERGEIMDYLFMFITLDGIMVIILIFAFLFLSIKRRKPSSNNPEANK
ncbi:MAG: hypothetical protein HQ538_06325 [Parcubacteria group bacterium]|nr:hypothetical protein [Parcubacteria group bacterium]